MHIKRSSIDDNGTRKMYRPILVHVKQCSIYFIFHIYILFHISGQSPKYRAILQILDTYKIAHKIENILNCTNIALNMNKHDTWKICKHNDTKLCMHEIVNYNG